MTIVKVYRVFPSYHLQTVSSQLIQLHYTNTGDSREVVTPFMRVGTYSTRYFAALGPSSIQPPLIEIYNTSFKKNTYFSSYNIGQVSNPLHLFTNLQSPKFLLNSRHPLFCYTIKAPLIPKLRSYFAEFLQYYY